MADVTIVAYRGMPVCPACSSLDALMPFTLPRCPLFRMEGHQGIEASRHQGKSLEYQLNGDHGIRNSSVVTMKTGMSTGTLYLIM